MSKIYDVFADEYIDEEDVDANAPPERYKDVDYDLLINNAARWILEGIRRTDGRSDKQKSGDKFS